MADVYQRISPSDQWIYDDDTGDLIGVRRRGMNGADLRVDGLSTGQLADLTGAPTATPTSSDTVVGEQGGVVVRFKQNELGPLVSVFQYMTAAQVADVTSGTGAVDVSAAIAACLAANTTAYAPPGRYRVSSALNPPTGRRLFGDKEGTVFYLVADVSFISTSNAVKFNDMVVEIDATQTADVVYLNMNTGGAFQGNAIDFSGMTIRGYNADCVAFHFKATNGSYMAYNNMQGLAVTHEGVQQACILLEVDNSGSYIQGNTFGNVNLIRGGVRYKYNGTADDSTLMKGNNIYGTFQTGTGVGEVFEQSGVYSGWMWDSAGNNNLSFHQNSAGVAGGMTFFELNGPDKWGLLGPDFLVVDGWGRQVEKFSTLATGVAAYSLSTASKAQRGLVEILDPCVKSLDPRFTLTGMSQAGEIVSIGDLRRSAIAVTNTATLADEASVVLPYTACTLSKLPEFKVALRKQIAGYYGGGTPAAWNLRLDAEVGMLSDDFANGIFARFAGIGGADVQTSIVSLIHKVGGVETVLDASLALLQNEQLYLTIYIDDDTAYIKATKVAYNVFAGARLAENASYGATTGWKSVARSALFNANTVTLNPQLRLISADKEASRAVYHLYGIEFRCGEM